MRRWIGCLCFVAALACLDHGLYQVRTQSADPINVEWVTPVGNPTVSNTITLTVNAQSLAGPIVYVDFYRDDVFFKRVYNTNYLPGPTNLAAKR